MKFISITARGAKVFDDLVQQQSPAFVKFYNEGCGHCQNMAGAWADLENEIKPYENIDLNIIEVHSDAIPQIKSQCAREVRGYPTIMEVAPGGKSGQEHSDERTTKALMNTIKKIMKKHNSKTEHGKAGSLGNEEMGEGRLGKRKKSRKRKRRIKTKRAKSKRKKTRRRYSRIKK